MNLWKQIRARAVGLFGKRRLDAEMDEEMRAHVELRTQQHITAGLKPDAARYAALRQFGWVESLQEKCRDQRGVGWLEAAARDLRYGARMLRLNPGFTAVAVATLALGIGANTAVFSALDAVLLKPLPYQDPDRLMMLWVDNPTFNLGIHELPPSQLDIMDWRRQANSFRSITAFNSSTLDLSAGGELKRVGAVEVTGNFFSTLGIAPALGRTFSPDEEQPGKDKVAVISYGLWQREFGGDPTLIGRSITLNNENRSVVGIMPPGFTFPHRAEMPAPYGVARQTDTWIPAARDAQFWQDDVNRQFIVIGRLKPGVTLARAQAEMETIGRRVAQERPATHTGWSNHLRPLALQVAGQARPVLFMLLGAVAFVLLIACANVANLLLCRSAARRKELAIRAAIGAGRARMIRQLLTESVALAALGGGLGLVLGRVGLRLLLAAAPANIPRLHEATFNGTVFAFSFVISLATGALFGLLPALKASKIDLGEALNSTGRNNSAGGRARSFGGIVTAEVAIAVTLLVGAALMLQSFQRLLAVDTGFAKTGLCALDLTFRGARYDKGESRVAYFEQAIKRLTSLPGIRSVAATSHLPLGGTENVGYFLVEGAPEPAPGKEPLGESRLVTLGYFSTMGVQLLQGRDFDASDGPGKPLVTIVSENLARQFFPSGDAIGKRIKLKQPDGMPWLTIVGVVHDVRGTALDVKPHPAFYRPHAQDPGYWDEMTLVARYSDGAPVSSLETTLRRELKVIDPTLPVANFRRMETLVSEATARPRFSSLLLVAFAGTALILTMVGLYGVVAYTVNQRTRELGIRMALGARPSDVLGLVIRQGMRPALVGLGLGVLSALCVTRLLTAQLFEIRPADPLTFVVVSVVSVVVTFLACWLPARRAAKVDPMVALRNE